MSGDQLLPCTLIPDVWGIGNSCFYIGFKNKPIPERLWILKILNLYLKGVFFRKAFCENFSNIFQSELEVVNY